MFKKAITGFMLSVSIAVAGTSIQSPLLDTPLRTDGGIGVYTCNTGQLSVDPDGNYVCVSCPTGTTYNPSTGYCEASGSVSCPTGGTYDGITAQCVTSASITCPTGGTYNPSTGQCEVDAQGFTIVKQGFSFENTPIFWYGAGFEWTWTCGFYNMHIYYIGFQINFDSQRLEIKKKYCTQFTRITQFFYGDDCVCTSWGISVIKATNIMNAINLSFYLGFPVYSNGDYEVYFYIDKGKFRMYTPEADSWEKIGDWISIFDNASTRTNVSIDAWFEFDGLGHFRFRDRKGYDTGWQPLFCPLGSNWDANLQACVSGTPCPTGYTLDTSTNTCIASASISCPTGYTYNSITGICEATATNTCPTGTVYNPDTGTCVISPTVEPAIYQ